MEDRFVIRVAICALIVWLVWFFHPSLAERMMIHWNGEKVGQWGDSFGALNALMSTLAFAAVLYTLRLQQRQIDDAQRDQHIQRFESSYFELLRLFREARAAIKFEYSAEYRQSKGYANRAGTPFIGVGAAIISKPQTGQRQGDEAFTAAMIEFRFWMQTGGVVSKSNKNLLVEIYSRRIHDRYEGRFGPYFRLMYTILQRISEDDKLSPNEKARYGNLLRSQISSYEAAMAGIQRPFADLKGFLKAHHGV